MSNIEEIKNLIDCFEDEHLECILSKLKNVNKIKCEPDKSNNNTTKEQIADLISTLSDKQIENSLRMLQKVKNSMIFDQSALKAIQKIINPEFLSSSSLQLQMNVGDTNSIKIKSITTPYRIEGMGNNDMLFCRIKSSGKTTYFHFPEKYKQDFEELGFNYTSINSDSGFIRISINDILNNLDDSYLCKLLNKIYIETFSFNSFGCCSRYKECSKEKKCIHDDLLYSSACMYRKNLENGRIFYSESIEQNIESWHNSIEIGYPKSSSPERKNKGKSLIAFPDRFIVLDIETTGLSSVFCEIIEVSALKVENESIIDKFSTLIKPDKSINDFITELTGITNEMLETAPKFQDIEKDLRDFLGNEIIVGHNVNFDINFLYDNFSEPLTNDFIDTMRISRKVLPELPHHRLKDLSAYYTIDYSKAHRAEQDCLITLECLKKLKADIIEKYGTLEDFTKPYKKHYYKQKLKASELSKDENSVVNEDNYLYEKVCVFTGELKISRGQAMQLVLNVGGKVADNVTKKTDILVVGNNGFSNEKSSKQKKAEEYILKGQNLEIISESMFYEFIGLNKEVVE